jgi:hypothetical protein
MATLLAAPILLLHIAAAGETCTYDQDAQREQLNTWASDLPSVSWMPMEIGFSWTQDDRSYSLTYGGCHHLGHRVSVEWPASELPTESEALRVGKNLAERFWSPVELALLDQSVEGRAWTHEASSNGETFLLRVTDYSEFYVRSERAEHGVRVTIFWSRNF